MKITLEFEHPHELINLLKSLGSNLIEEESCTECCEDEEDDMGLKGYSYDD